MATFQNNIAKVTGPIFGGLFGTGTSAPIVKGTVALPVFGGVGKLFPPITHQPVQKLKAVQHPPLQKQLL